jgi:hypothetical protein
VPNITNKDGNNLQILVKEIEKDGERSKEPNNKSPMILKEGKLLDLVVKPP